MQSGASRAVPVGLVTRPGPPVQVTDGAVVEIEPEAGVAAFAPLKWKKPTAATEDNPTIAADRRTRDEAEITTGLP